MGNYNNFSNEAIRAFIEGRAKKVRNVVSTGKELFYHGNLIAEWKIDGLHISNGNYTTYSKSGVEIPGSKTTKGYLNELPKVRINQSQCKWYLNGVQWEGEWQKIEGTITPEIKENKGNYIDERTSWQATDGWRGYEEPFFGVAGVNNTGGWSDSPCPSDIAGAEIQAIKNELQKAGIKTKIVTLQTSNVFCVHHYLIPKVKDVSRAREIVKEYLQNNETRLAYIVEHKKEEIAA